MARANSGGSQSESTDGKLLTDRELSKILKDNGQADYVTKFSRGAFGGPGPLDFNIPGAGGDWSGSLQDWRQQNPSLLTPVIPTVEIVGSMPTYVEWMANKFKTTPEIMAERLGSGNDPLYDFKVSQRSYYRDGEANAANSVTRELWHMAGLASKAGNNLGAAGYGLYRIATNGDARSAAAASLKHTWDNVPRIMARQASDFSNMTLRERSDAIISFGLESAATLGVGKAAGFTGNLAYQGGKHTLKWLAPKAGELLENYMYRSGALAYAVPPGPMQQTVVVGKNTVTFTVDANGAPLSASGSLREAFSGAGRSSAELQAQRAVVAASGLPGDQAGHLAAHRFVLDNGPMNLFPQEGNFNMSAFKTLENDYARHVRQGNQVDFNHTLENFSASGRPGAVSVTYRVLDPAGTLVDAWSGRFLNQAGQTYVRRSK